MSQSLQVAPCTRDAEYKRFRSALEAYCNQATPTEAATVKEGTVCAQQKTATGEWARILRVDQTQVGNKNDHLQTPVCVAVFYVSLRRCCCFLLPCLGLPHGHWWHGALKRAAVCAPASCAERGPSSRSLLFTVW